MIFYDYYTDVPDEVVDAFMRAQDMGRLVSVGEHGLPHIGLYPFAYSGEAIELHLVRSDDQVDDLRAHPRCVFELDEVLAVIPSHWVHPENAIMATAYHRTVIFECEATLSGDPTELAAQQNRMLARYQPEGGFRPVSADDPMYRGAIDFIAAVHLRIVGRRVKFKLGQNRSAAVRSAVATRLRERGRHNDARAAAALQWTIDRESR